MAGLEPQCELYLGIELWTVHDVVQHEREDMTMTMTKQILGFDLTVRNVVMMIGGLVLGYLALRFTLGV